MVKSTGAEFKRFYNDSTFWPDDVWHEEEVVTVNGVVLDGEVSFDAIADDAQVGIEGGIVNSPRLEWKEPSFEAYFKRWRKLQSTTTFLVECDRSVVDAVKKAIVAAGGRVPA